MVLVQHQRLPDDDYLVVYLDRMQPSLGPCPGPPQPVIVPCSTSGVPRRLWATLHSVSGCSCLDGLSIPLDYGPVNPPNSSGVAEGWQFHDNGNIELYHSYNHQLQTGWMLSIFSDIVADFGQFCFADVIDANNFKINIGTVTLGTPQGAVSWRLVPNWQGKISCGCSGAADLHVAVTPCAPWSTNSALWQLCIWGSDLLPAVRAQSQLFTPSYQPFSSSMLPITGPYTAWNYPTTVNVCTDIAIALDHTPSQIAVTIAEHP